jgi:nucleotide-binding universal stress UspA family protein
LLHLRRSGKVHAKEFEIMTRNEIVVGLDDSPSAKAALRWAAEQAIRRQDVLRAVHIFDWPYGPRDITVDAARKNTNMTFDAAQAAYMAGITKVFDDISPRPDWLIQFATGEPGPVLVRQSRDSQLLVVGTREHVGLGRLLTGSISHYCLSRADCPVVCVPAELADQRAAARAVKNEIVVGLDVSPSARAALVWAAEHARASGQSLRAVHAVDVSPDFNLQLGMGGIAVPMNASAMDTARRETIMTVFNSIQPEPDWRLEFFSGQAGPVLLAESVGAALLVVGAKEHVGIGRLVHGSVSHYCLSHAQCLAVVAVPSGLDHGVDKDHDHGAADTPAQT